jgi:hypothetical protein
MLKEYKFLVGTYFKERCDAIKVGMINIIRTIYFMENFEDF